MIVTELKKYIWWQSMRGLIRRKPIAICNGKIGKTRSIADVNFLINTVQMHFDGALRDIELATNFFIR